MQKRIKMTKEQGALYKELKSLAKLTNQRILRLERNLKYEPKVVTDLKEKLNTEMVKAISPKGRVKVRKDFTTMQMKAIIKELKTFKESPYSTKRQRKKIYLPKGVKTLVETQGITEREAERSNVYF